MKKKVLIHICCAPCFCHCYTTLLDLDYDITGYWYNPNIHPASEYQKRLDTLYKFQAQTQCKIEFKSKYNIKEWLLSIEPTLNVGKKMRCNLCYNIRLIEAVKYASKQSFDCFSTTLLYSKYQFHDDIKAICEELSKQYNIPFLYIDFRKGWQKGIELSHQYGLYRQKYCGCIFS